MDLQKFAAEWIHSWNSHDLDQILSHYSSDIQVSTSMIKQATGLTTKNWTLEREQIWNLDS